MVRLRLDHRLQGRVDPSDVVQESFIDLVRELPAYSQKQAIPLFLWMRLVTGQRLMRVHREYLGTKKRDASREISLQAHALQVDPGSMAEQLLAGTTSPSNAAVRAEKRDHLRQALDRMKACDKEIIALRNFENLDNVEAAVVLGISESAASKRYVRALKRLQQILCEIPELDQEFRLRGDDQAE